jgi:putative Mn2+ efflux pump MntP
MLFLSLVSLLSFVLMCWALRDGLGSDSTASYGIVAFQRFIFGCWPHILISSILGFIGFWLIHPIFSKKSNSKTSLRK